MKTEHVESFEELVFKNKNKLYGAYILRRKYNKSLVIALLCGLFLLLSAISYPLISAYLNPVHIHRVGPGTITFDPIDPTMDPTPPPPLPPVESAPPERLRFVAPVVVDRDVETDLASQDELGSQSVSATPPGETVVSPVSDNSGQVIEQPAPPAEPWVSVEEMPQFPGGEAELFRFLKENIHYPQEAREIGITGRVFIYFVVEPDGSISGISVRRGIGSGCDEEALRVIGLMPKWSPGRQGGVPVRVQFTLPVRFTLQ